MRFRLLVNLAVILALIIVFIDVVVLFWMHRSLSHQTATSKFQNLTAITISLAHEPNLHNRKIYLDTLCKRSPQKLMLTNQKQKIIWAYDPLLQGKKLSELNIAIIKDAKTPRASQSQVVYSLPIITHHGIDGFIAELVDFSNLWQFTFATHKPILLYFIIDYLLILLFGFFSIGRFFIKPIDKLHNAVSQLQLDDPLFTMPESGTEINKLGRAIGKMKRTIEHDKEKLEVQYHELHTVYDQLKEAQDTIVEQERLAIAGKLAASIAHDIGNPLGIIQGYCGLVDQNSTYEETKSYINKIEHELQRIQNSIRGLLEISRPQELELEPVAIKSFLQKHTERLKTSSRLSHCSITCLCPEDFTIYIDESRFSRVLENLIINAADALLDTQQKGNIQVSATLENHQVNISIEDNGPGIPDEHQTKVFSPFFSTKDTHLGTGLGLYIVKHILDQHNAKITISTSALGGTNFTITLVHEQ